MKKFLISIDTEGDNLWSWKDGNLITTNNAKYLERFQKLCNENGFKPTYLTNYELAISKDFQRFIKSDCAKGKSEVGMHLHAWNNPPEYPLQYSKENAGAPYLIEYPEEIMEQKIEYTTNLLEDIFEHKMTSHRAGRWAMNETYFKLIDKYGYKYDCSVTPSINWEQNAGGTINSKGANYEKYPVTPFNVENTNILEIPVTIKSTHHMFAPVKKGLRGVMGSIYNSIQGQKIWLRPTGFNTQKMLWLLDMIRNDDNLDYVMFMLHSSEFMPGGSPTFRTEESIDLLYDQIETVFNVASQHFEGLTISEYGDSFMSNK